MRVSTEHSSVFRCALSGSWSPLIGQCQGRALVIAVGPGCRAWR